MPKFAYTVKNLAGQTVQAEAEAYDKAGLVKQLQQQGYFILKLEEVTATALKVATAARTETAKKFLYKKIKLSDLVSFARQLSTMLEAGVTLLRSLEVITQQTESERFYKVMSQVTRQVEQGRALSEALAEHPRIFNQFWVSLIEVGEASGTLPNVLAKLTFYMEQKAAFNTAIKSAIMYPAVLFCVCLLAIAFFALFVGPRFEGVFKTMGVELPLITRMLLSSFRFIKNNVFWIAVSVIGGTVAFKKWSRTTAGKAQVERFIYGLPTFGNIFKLVVLERFTSQMAILIESGVPILHALDITQRLVDNVACSQVIAGIKESVRQGELLVNPMQRSNFFPHFCIQMINVGEETGELSKMFNHVAAYYQDTVETFMKRLGTVIEPFMLIFMGGIIGVIVLAMFLPMFNISQLGGAGGG